MRGNRTIVTIAAPFGAGDGVRPRTRLVPTPIATFTVAPPHRRPPLE